MKRRKRLAVLAVATGALTPSACAPPAVIGLGPPGPRSFQYGYADGCNEGYNVAGSPVFALNRIETATPPQVDGPYRTGWEQGFIVCRRSYDRVQRTVHTLFGPL